MQISLQEGYPKKRIDWSRKEVELGLVVVVVAAAVAVVHGERGTFQEQQLTNLPVALVHPIQYRTESTAIQQRIRS